MKRVFTTALAAALLLAGCSWQALPSDPGEAVSQPQQAVSVSEPSASTDSTPSAAESEEAEPAAGCGATVCEEHTLSYHTLLRELIDYVGKQNSDEWADRVSSDTDAYGRVREEFTIQAFLEEFSIPRGLFEQIVDERAEGGLPSMGLSEEEYREQYGYTEAQIDALYSGDQAQINEAFCGPLAYFNEADGQLYSIYWLAEHTAEEYLEAGLPLDAVEEILTRAQEDYELVPAVTSLAESVEETFASAVALEEAALEAAASEETLPVSGETVLSVGCGAVVCEEHTYSYHTILLSLIRYVGNKDFNEWEHSNSSGPDAYGRVNEDNINIQTFLEEFSIPRGLFEQVVDERAVRGSAAMELPEDEYREQFGYTEAQIDALYSGDQAQINEAFCGPLAYFNEADGQLYSIYWLADHTAEEYLEAGLPLDAVEEILTRAQEDYELVPAVTSLAESVEETYASAVALEEAALEAAASEETLPVSEETETAE